MNLDLGVRNNEDLKDAWIMVTALTEFIPEAKKTDKCLEMIKKYKQAIRQYNRTENPVKAMWGDFDGYTELIKFPSWVCDEAEARQYFEEFYELHYYPSQFDCTGQKFTTGAKFVYRGDRWYCYHSVGVAV